MTAISNIEVLTAHGAQTFAVRPAGWTDRDLQQGVFADKRLQVDLGVFRHDEARIAYRLFVEGVHLRQRPVELLIKRSEAADALQSGMSRETAGEEQALGGSSNIEKSVEIPKLQVRTKEDTLDRERKVVAVTDLLVDEKTDIKTEWLACVTHGNLVSSRPGCDARRGDGVVSRWIGLFRTRLFDPR